MSASVARTLSRMLSPKKNKGPKVGGASDGPRFKAPGSQIQELFAWNPHSKEATYYDREHEATGQTSSSRTTKRTSNLRKRYRDEIAKSDIRRPLKHAESTASGKRGRNNPRRKHQDDRTTDGGRRDQPTPPPYIPLVVPDRVPDVPDGDPDDGGGPIEPELDVPVEFDIPEEPEDGEEDPESEEENFPGCEDLPPSMRAIFGYPRNCSTNRVSIAIGVEKPGGLLAQRTAKTRKRDSRKGGD